jgi:hypothetical protein
MHRGNAEGLVCVTVTPKQTSTAIPALYHFNIKMKNIEQNHFQVFFNRLPNLLFYRKTEHPLFIFEQFIKPANA